MEKKSIDKALVLLVIDALSDIKDINEIACYGFDLSFKDVIKVKGTVKVEFEEVE